MLDMDTRETHYVGYNRNDVKTGTDNRSFNGLLSMLFSDELYYRTGYSNELDLKDRAKYDVFEYETVKVNLDSYGWREVIDLVKSGNNSIAFFDACNEVLTKNGYPQILNMANTKRDITSAWSLDWERGKRRKFITHAVLKDSVKYIPCEEHIEPVLKEGGKVKLFNMFYKDSIESILKSFGITQDSYDEKYVELINNGNTFQLHLQIRDDFANEFVRVTTELLPDIFERMFNGKFKPMVEAYHINVDEIIKGIIENGCTYYSFKVDIPVDKLLPKENDNA